jgi:hypothetical protein
MKVFVCSVAAHKRGRPQPPYGLYRGPFRRSLNESDEAPRSEGVMAYSSDVHGTGRWRNGTRAMDEWATKRPKTAPFAGGRSNPIAA